MITINLIRDRKLARVTTKTPGAGFKFTLPQMPFNMGILISVVAFVIVLAVIALTFLSQRARISFLRKQIDSYNEELTKLSGPKRLVDEYIAKQGEVSTKLNEISGIDKGRFNVVKVMTALNSAMPEHVWLTLTNDEGAKFTIEGVTFSNIIVADFMERLKASGYFSNVELVEAKKVEIEERELVKFSLNTGITFPSATDTTKQAAAPAGKGKP